MSTTEQVLVRAAAVAALTASGTSAPEIASLLAVSCRTVRRYRVGSSASRARARAGRQEHDFESVCATWTHHPAVLALVEAWPHVADLPRSTWTPYEWACHDAAAGLPCDPQDAVELLGGRPRGFRAKEISVGVI